MAELAKMKKLLDDLITDRDAKERGDKFCHCGIEQKKSHDVKMKSEYERMYKIVKDVVARVTNNVACDGDTAIVYEVGCSVIGVTVYPDICYVNVPYKAWGGLANEIADRIHKELCDRVTIIEEWE